MTRSSIVAAVVVTLLLGLLLWWRDERTSVERATEALTPPSGAVLRATGEVTAQPSARSVSPAVGPSIEVPAVAPPRAPRPMTEAMRERRRRVLDSPEARKPAANPASSAASAAQPQTMKDRTGKLGPEVKAFNEQLGPLVDQCFDQAKERGVRGSGMLAVEVKFAAAEGIGRVIESLEPLPNNEVHDAELIDCVRQSAFTVDLPPPTSSGGSEVMLTIPFEGAADAGAPTSR
ncbi:MAG TPA: hypothetical protein VNN80_01525 [Polyangiaceae bacterium]|nr:hypothetical protein [Polyangiaceae bacterium]